MTTWYRYPARPSVLWRVWFWTVSWSLLVWRLSIEEMFKYSSYSEISVTKMAPCFLFIWKDFVKSPHGNTSVCKLRCCASFCPIVRMDPVFETWSQGGNIWKLRPCVLVWTVNPQTLRIDDIIVPPLDLWTPRRLKTTTTTTTTTMADCMLVLVLQKILSLSGWWTTD